MSQVFELPDLEAYEPLPAGQEQYPVEFCEENRVIKIRETEAEVIAAGCCENEASLLELLEFHHTKPVRYARVQAPVFAAALSRIFGTEQLTALDSEASEYGFHLDALENDAPVVNFINGVLLDAIRLNASDVHLECFSEHGTVRFRIDGSLVQALRFPASRFQSISARIKIMANLNIMEKRLPQDGRISVEIGQEKIELRVSIVPIARGESIVLRLLGRASAPKTFTELGMDEATVLAVGNMLAYPHGLVLVTGPTGSGKTTTLNAMLRKIQSETLKIVTIEDPVEYVLDGIDQIQVNEQIGLSFDSLLRRVLRQDPNIIMVGEVRDAATAELVMRSALTGHLVLTTLHTNDSVSAVSRLRNIGIEPYLIAAVLRGVVAQRLVRKLCPHCAKKTDAKPSELALAEKHQVRMQKVWHAAGCPACNNTGYAGRFALYEYFLNDESLEDMIVHGANLSELRSYLYSKQKMKTLARTGLEKAAAGETTMEELEREIEL